MNFINTSKNSLNYIYKQFENNFKNTNYANNPQRTQTILTKNDQGQIIEKPQIIQTEAQKQQHNRVTSQECKNSLNEFLTKEIAEPFFTHKTEILKSHTIIEKFKLLHLQQQPENNNINLSEIKQLLSEIVDLQETLQNHLLNIHNELMDNIKNSLENINTHITSINILNKNLDQIDYQDFAISDSLDQELNALSQTIDIETKYTSKGSIEEIYSPMLKTYLFKKGDYFLYLDFIPPNLSQNNAMSQDIGQIKTVFRNFNQVDIHSNQTSLKQFEDKNFGGFLQALIKEPKTIEYLYTEFSKSLNIVIDTLNKASSTNILHEKNHLQGKKRVNINDFVNLENESIELLLVKNHSNSTIYSSDQIHIINQDKMKKIWDIDPQEIKIFHIIEAMNYELALKNSNNQVKIGLIESLNNQFEINNVNLIQNINKDLILEIEGNAFQNSYVRINNISYTQGQNKINLIENQNILINKEDSAILNIGNIEKNNIPPSTEITIELSLTDSEGKIISENNNIKLQFDVNQDNNVNTNYFFANKESSTGANLNIIFPDNVATMNTSIVSQDNPEEGFLNLKIENNPNNNYSIFIKQSENFLYQNGFLDIIYYDHSRKKYIVNNDLISQMEKNPLHISDIIQNDIEEFKEKGFIYEIEPRSNFLYQTDLLSNNGNLQNQLERSVYNIKYIINSSSNSKNLSYLQDISNNPTEDQILSERKLNMSENLYQIQFQFSAIKTYFAILEDFLKMIG